MEPNQKQQENQEENEQVTDMRCMSCKHMDRHGKGLCTPDSQYGCKYKQCKFSDLWLRFKFMVKQKNNQLDRTTTGFLTAYDLVLETIEQQFTESMLKDIEFHANREDDEIKDSEVAQKMKSDAIKMQYWYQKANKLIKDWEQKDEERTIIKNPKKCNKSVCETTKKQPKDI